jgi:hypothetical protein
LLTPWNQNPVCFRSRKQTIVCGKPNIIIVQIKPAYRGSDSRTALYLPRDNILPFPSSHISSFPKANGNSPQTTPYRHRAALVNWGGTRSFGAKRSADAPQDDIVSKASDSRTPLLFSPNFPLHLDIRALSYYNYINT